MEGVDLPPGNTPQRYADLPGRGSWLWSVYCWSCVVVGLLISTALAVPIGGLAALLGDRRRRVAHRMLAIGYAIIRMMVCRVTSSLSGLENLPVGACVLAGNHESLADIVYLYRFPLHVKWLVKKEFLRIPLFGIAIRLADYPVVDRGDRHSATRLLEKVGVHLAAGVPVFSFPEGTRSRDGALGPFHSGTVRIAVANQAPLVPVGLVGSGYLLPSQSKIFARRAHIAIHIGPPISTAGATRKDVRRLNRELRRAVLDARAIAGQAAAAASR